MISSRPLIGQPPAPQYEIDKFDENVLNKGKHMSGIVLDVFKKEKLVGFWSSHWGWGKKGRRESVLI